MEIKISPLEKRACLSSLANYSHVICRHNATGGQIWYCELSLFKHKRPQLQFSGIANHLYVAPETHYFVITPFN